jgi:uncharacterized protein (DUF924 family)
MHEWTDEVLQFWFHELQPIAWFRKDEQVDTLIRGRFEELHQRLAASAPERFSTPRASLAAVIVLDQFPRNMYRNSPRAFATDAKALAISARAIGAGYDQLLSSNERVFLYMPFQHSEDAAVQARSVELFGTLDDPETLSFAIEHQKIIDRFGRFPHRNAALQRASTAEEIEFMKQHRGF